MLKRALLAISVSAVLVVTGAGAAVSASAAPAPKPGPVSPFSVSPGAVTAHPDTARLGATTAKFPVAPHGTFADAELGTVVSRLKSGASLAGLPGARVSGGRVRVEILHAAGHSVSTALAAASASNVHGTTPTVTTADVPYAELAKLQSADSVSYLRLAQTINAGTPDDPTSADQSSSAQGSQDQDAPVQQGNDGADVINATNAAAWHAKGWTGAGESIAIIDGGFSQSVYDSDLASGELPAVAGTFCEDDGAQCSLWQGYGVHGDAVAEIIHDEAPNARIYFAVANTLQDYRDAIDYFSAHGVSVITRSLGTILDGPGDGTGPSDEVQDYAISKGIAWFNSAGNEGIENEYAAYHDYTGGYWRGTWTPLVNPASAFNGDEVFGTGPSASLGLEMECGYFEGLRWNDWGANPTDYDLTAFATDGTTVIATSNNSQVNGATPIEGQDFASEINCTEYPEYYLVVSLVAAGNGTAGDNLEMMTNSYFYDLSSDGSLLSDAYSATDAFVDSNNPGAAAVGAVDPLTGTTIADYSAQGPTNDGRIKPDISAPAGGITSAYGPSTPFHGTSAASPLAASAALLVRQAHPSDTPAQLIAEIEAHDARDLGNAGADNVFGHGEVYLGTPPSGGPAVAPVLAPTPTPAISGTLAKGHTLTAKAGTWGPKGVVLSYQWELNGAKISKATHSKFTLTSSDPGEYISVVVSGTLKGYATVHKTSASRFVALRTFTKTRAPKITGTVAVGHVLKVSLGASKWKPKPSGFTYQWYETNTANAMVAIPAATASSYRVGTADIGRKIEVRVIAHKAHYAPTTKTSAVSRPVA